jgi:hypothetical protein
VIREGLFSRHCMVRSQQRGITPAQIDAVVRYADMECHRGRGCVSIWISRKEIRRLGPSTPEGVSTDRLHGLIVLQGSDQARVTVVRSRRSNVYLRIAGRRR